MDLKDIFLVVLFMYLIMFFELFSMDDDRKVTPDEQSGTVVTEVKKDDKP